MRYLIIGNSAAAAGCIEGIRRHDGEGDITLVASEEHHVYSRPLISYLLQGKTDRQRMQYRPADFYQNNNVKTPSGPHRCAHRRARQGRFHTGRHAPGLRQTAGGHGLAPVRAAHRRAGQRGAEILVHDAGRCAGPAKGLASARARAHRGRGAYRAQMRRSGVGPGGGDHRRGHGGQGDAHGVGRRSRPARAATPGRHGHAVHSFRIP